MTGSSAPRRQLAARAARKSAPAAGLTYTPPWASAGHGNGNPRQLPYLATVGATMSVPAIYEEEESNAGPSNAIVEPENTLYPQYCWEAQSSPVSAEDFVDNRISYHSKIKADIEIVGGGSITVAFTRGMQIYVLPDPSSLPAPTTNATIQPSQLPPKQHFAAEILDACSYAGGAGGGSPGPLGLLRVAWLYTPSQILDSKHFPSYVKDAIRSAEYRPNERIKTDHIDFISLETYACPATDVSTRIEITGLTVPNNERGLEVGKRAKIQGKVTVKLPDPDSGSEGSINLKSDGDE